MVKTPAFLTCSVATSAKVAINFVHWDFFTSVAVANASASAPFVMGLAPALIAFIAGAIFSVQGKIMKLVEVWLQRPH